MADSIKGEPSATLLSVVKTITVIIKKDAKIKLYFQRMRNVFVT